LSAKTQRVDNWDDLRFFLAVARAEGLSGAARALRVNQSTVSRRITALETQLDATLFERHARGYALTTVGEAMFELATRVEDDVFAVDRAVSGADATLAGRVRLTTVDEVLDAVVPTIAGFVEAYPGIELEVDTEVRTASLTRREADVALRPGLAPTEPDIVGRKLVRLDYAFYASPGYIEQHGRPRRVADLPRHRFVGFAGERRQSLLRSFVAEPRLVFVAHAMPAQASAVRAGMGIAYLPRFVAEHDERLVRVLAPRVEHGFHLWLLIHADLRQTARVRAFVDALTEAVRADRSRYEARGSSGPAKSYTPPR